MTPLSTLLARPRALASAAALALGLGLGPVSAETVDLQFFFPLAVGANAANVVERMTETYMAQNSGVKITAIHAGGYSDTLTRTLTSVRGGNPPQLAILLSTDMFTLIDEDIILPWDDFITAEEKDSWIGSFFPAFMRNSQTGGQTWGIPFKRSTPVMFYNRDAFVEAGLDPDQPPATWQELIEMGRALTERDANGNVTRWGVRIPSSGFPSWLMTGLVASAGQDGLAKAEGNEVFFDTPEAISALEYMVSLSKEHGIMEPGVLDWGATPRAFMDGNAAIAWTTTGNLSTILNDAPFDVGVAMLPGNLRRGAPTGGGNFYLMRDTTPEQRKAAVDFVRWATAPEQAAYWSINTGFVATSPAAWETDAMRARVTQVPGAAVARDQLEFAVAELSTFEGPRITQLLNDNIAAAIVGQKTPAQAMADAQLAADAILAAYR